MISAGQAALVTASLERVGEACGDPAPLVYARLFQRWPELEPMFMLDRDGAVRGEMLALALRSLLDVAEGAGAGAGMIRAELVNHSGYDVPPAVFARFYEVVAEVVAERLGTDWTAETAQAWRALLAAVSELITAQAAESGLSLELA